MTELETLKAELQWAVANNGDRPRTELALRWAVEAIEKMEMEREDGSSSKTGD